MQAGGAIVEILGGESKISLNNWVGNFMLFTTTVRDPDAMLSQSVSALVRREYTYVVEMPAMKIKTIYIGTTDGSKPGGISSSLKQGMDEVMMLLGH